MDRFIEKRLSLTRRHFFRRVSDFNKASQPAKNGLPHFAPKTFAAASLILNLDAAVKE